MNKMRCLSLTYEWNAFFQMNGLRPLPKITEYAHFRFLSTKLGKVEYQVTCDGLSVMYELFPELVMFINNDVLPSEIYSFDIDRITAVTLQINAAIC